MIVLRDSNEFFIGISVFSVFSPNRHPSYQPSTSLVVYDLIVDTRPKKANGEYPHADAGSYRKQFVICHHPKQIYGVSFTEAKVGIQLQCSI